jgi:ATP-dependent protease ClpP protease subunit
MQKSSDAMYAVFCGQINEQSAQNLIRHLASATQKVKHVHLFFQSNGGISTCAIGLYEFLKSYPISISIYNMSSLQSAAVTVYLGAKRRIVGSRANFR